MAEALGRRGPPLRTVLQHAQEEVGESRRLLQQEVVLLHQDVVEVPESLWAEATQVTWARDTGFFFCSRLLPSGDYTTYRELSDPPLRLKYSAAYLPEKATSGGILPSSSMIWATWSEKTKTHRQESLKRCLK